MGNNMFAYCNNNPVNYSDPTGTLPKWVNGILTTISGATQMMAGFAIEVTVGWTGFGAAAGAFLIANGAATIVSGMAQVSNDLRGTDYCEENQLRVIAQSVDEFVWGSSEIEIVSAVYDAANISATLYSLYGGYGQIAGELANLHQVAAATIPTIFSTSIQNIQFSIFTMNSIDIIGGVTDAINIVIKIFESK